MLLMSWLRAYTADDRRFHWSSWEHFPINSSLPGIMSGLRHWDTKFRSTWFCCSLWKETTLYVESTCTLYGFLNLGRWSVGASVALVKGVLYSLNFGWQQRRKMAFIIVEIVTIELGGFPNVTRKGAEKIHGWWWMRGNWIHFWNKKIHLKCAIDSPHT